MDPDQPIPAIGLGDGYSSYSSRWDSPCGLLNSGRGRSHCPIPRYTPVYPVPRYTPGSRSREIRRCHRFCQIRRCSRYCERRRCHQSSQVDETASATLRGSVRCHCSHTLISPQRSCKPSQNSSIGTTEYSTERVSSVALIRPTKAEMAESSPSSTNSSIQCRSPT